MTEEQTEAKIAAINAWLRDYAARSGAVYADYWGALHDGDAMRALLTRDGVHPNAEGYAAMAPVADAAIRAAIAGGQEGACAGEALLQPTLRRAQHGRVVVHSGSSSSLSPAPSAAFATA